MPTLKMKKELSLLRTLISKEQEKRTVADIYHELNIVWHTYIHIHTLFNVEIHLATNKASFQVFHN